jgi:tRNA(fMet)-specific endonuclease VapC
MDYLLDTTTLSYVIEGNQLVTGRLKAAATSGAVYTSVISEGELTYGALRLGRERREELLDDIALLLDDLAGVIPVTRPVASVYSAMKRDLAARGEMIGLNDVWIGAAALSGGLTLVSSDRGFGRIRELVVEDWLEP